ncbi:SDR family oxidoreductase [Mobiluncus sp.]|uniref:SDR family oxidoreductase n=1 Tax=Mobiluncus sp. TaxID=47293 RepID=UPI002A91AF20|nr:SDR family oxidoreductase [Mobiluncus sp.]MDY6076188.1 SDR family oxidoreductase [Mobiluncus sp.]
MGVYVVTGVASGMGKATANELRWRGHRVIGIDIHHADICADLSTVEGRQKAIDEVHEQSGGRLEGAVFAAGLGPVPGKEELIAKVNYLGTVELAEGVRDLLANGNESKVVIFSSNSTTTAPGVTPEIVKAFWDRDIDTVLEIANQSEAPATSVYAGSKTSLAHWVRQTATSLDWAGAGIRMNAIAPGAIRTPMIQKQLDIPEYAEKIKSYPVPLGGFGDPADIAQWVLFMLSPAANFLCGSVIFMDGGTDAWFRANDFPLPLAPEQMAHYQERYQEYQEFRRQRDGK